MTSTVRCRRDRHPQGYRLMSASPAGECSGWGRSPKALPSSASPAERAEARIWRIFSMAETGVHLFLSDHNLIRLGGAPPTIRSVGTAGCVTQDSDDGWRGF